MVTWPILNFGGSSDICKTAEARVIKFCTQVDYIISQPKDDKPPIFNFDVRSHICGMAEVTVAKFYLQV